MNDRDTISPRSLSPPDAGSAASQLVAEVLRSQVGGLARSSQSAAEAIRSQVGGLVRSSQSAAEAIRSQVGGLATASQVAAEILRTPPPPAVFTSQFTAEALIVPLQIARSSQFATEVLAATGMASSSQFATETLVSLGTIVIPPSFAMASQFTAEVLAATGMGRASQVVAEALLPIIVPPKVARLSQLSAEVLVFPSIDEGGEVPPRDAGEAIAKYVCTGHVVDYVSPVDLDGGEVIVIGTSVGVTNRPISEGKQGELRIEGVTSPAKKDGEAIAFGVRVYWDDSAKVATAVPTAIGIGFCIRAALADDYRVRVKLVLGML